MIRNLLPLAGAVAFVAALAGFYLRRDRAMQRRAAAAGNRVLADLYAGTDAGAAAEFRARADALDHAHRGRLRNRGCGPVRVGEVLDQVVVDLAAAQLARDRRLRHPAFAGRTGLDGSSGGER